ncbi:MAG: arylesterase [Alphaproteobacteria bacterium]|nr:arylesterase [Alphaproteobacteria bacterium]
MKKLCLLLGGLMMSVSVMAAPTKLMVFGDSLSVGYKIPEQASFCAQLEKALQDNKKNVVVLNYSKSGETTAGGVAKVNEAVDVKPDGVILELGINDALEKRDLNDTNEDLQTLISSFLDNGIPVFLVGMEVPADAPEEYRDAFRQMYADLALENELLLYPFFMDGLWQDDGKHVSEDYFLPDGMHPSEKGVGIMVKRILPAVQQFLYEDVEK